MSNEENTQMSFLGPKRKCIHLPLEHRLSKEFVFNNLSTKVSSGHREDLRHEVPVVTCLAASLGMPGDFLRKSYDSQVLRIYKLQLP